MGKTRLVTELLGHRDVAESRRLVGRCHPIRELFPLDPLVEAVRGLREELDGARLGGWGVASAVAGADRRTAADAGAAGRSRRGAASGVSRPDRGTRRGGAGSSRWRATLRHADLPHRVRAWLVPRRGGHHAVDPYEHGVVAELHPRHPDPAGRDRIPAAGGSEQRRTRQAAPGADPARLPAWRPGGAVHGEHVEVGDLSPNAAMPGRPDCSASACIAVEARGRAL